MKKLLTLVLFIGACHLGVSAQPGQCQMHQKGGGKHQHQGRKGAMLSKLNLTNDQKDKIKSIHQDSRKQLDALKENRQQSLQQYDDARGRIHKETKDKINQVFTAEQKNTLTGLRKEKDDQRQAHMQRKLDNMKSRLSLTDAQYNQLKGMQEKNMQAIKAIRENEQMGPDAKHAAIKKIKETAMEDRKKIFTPEQQKKMEEFKKGHPFKKRQPDAAK